MKLSDWIIVHCQICFKEQNNCLYLNSVFLVGSTMKWPKYGNFKLTTISFAAQIWNTEVSSIVWYFLKREQMSLDDLIWNNTAGLLITWSLYSNFKLGSNSTWNSLSVQRANLKLQFSLVAEIKLRFSRQIRHISELAHLINIFFFSQNSFW